MRVLGGGKTLGGGGQGKTPKTMRARGRPHSCNEATRPSARANINSATHNFNTHIQQPMNTQMRARSAQIHHISNPTCRRAHARTEQTARFWRLALPSHNRRRTTLSPSFSLLTQLQCMERTHYKTKNANNTATVQQRQARTRYSRRWHMGRNNSLRRLLGQHVLHDGHQLFKVHIWRGHYKNIHKR